MDVTPRSSTVVTGVFVVGMGRSGTSVVTRVVNRLGVPLGRADDLLPANDANPAGGAHDALPRVALPPETPRTRRLIDEWLARPGAIAQPAVGV